MKSIAELFDLSGKGALVTGGAMGIGQAICFRLAEAGAAVMIADISIDAAQATVEEIRKKGGRAAAVKADVTSPTDARQAVQKTVETFGSLDILVNNAGIFPLMPFLEMQENLWDRVLGINLKGPFLFAQAAADQMVKAANGGRIVNILSIDALHPHGDSTAYNASKGGLLMLAKAMALELAPHNILVNCVAPGSINTPGTKSSAQYLMERGVDLTETWRKQRERVPLGIGKPDHIAKVVLFLASDAADYMTGDVILVDGGFMLS